MKKEEVLEEKIKIEKKKIDEDEAQWSIKRILIFLGILGIIIYIAYLFFTARFGEVLGERDENRFSSSPQISLPSQDDIDDIISDAEENISNIDAKDIVGSQPQIQNAIKQLEKLTSENGVKDAFCSSVCSE